MRRLGRPHGLLVLVAAGATTLGLGAITLPPAALGAATAPSAAAASRPQLSARDAILFAPATGQRLYGLAPDHPVAIASTTKLMTALVTLEHARLRSVFTDPDYHPAAADSQIGLTPGERMSVHDLLLALLLPSADDAAEDLAYNVGHRSVGRFVAMMNQRARELGLRGTHYSTPIGLDTPGNYSTAGDLVRLARYVMRTQPFFRRAVALTHAVLHTGSHVRVVVNRNDLVGRFPWINGVKTGHTLDAGYVLVGSARRAGFALLSAVLGTPSEAARDADTLALLNWGYATFRLRSPIHPGAVLARPAVRDQPGKHAVVIARRGFQTVVRRGARVVVRTRVPQQLAGPMARGTVVGNAAVLVSGRVVARVSLVLAQALPAVSPLTVAARFVTRPSTLLMLVVALVAAMAFAVHRRQRSVSAGEEKAEPA